MNSFYVTSNSVDLYHKPLILDVFLLDSSFQFNQMNAKDGTYLKKIFIEARYDTVKMYIHRYAAKKDIYLPKLGYKKAKLIVHRNDDTNFESRLGGNPVIHVPGIGNVEIRTNMAWTFYNKNGKWTIGKNETWTDSEYGEHFYTKNHREF